MFLTEGYISPYVAGSQNLTDRNPEGAVTQQHGENSLFHQKGKSHARFCQQAQSR